MVFGVRAGLRRHRQTLQMDENANRMLHAGKKNSNQPPNFLCSLSLSTHLPKRNTQPPNRLHLQTGGLGGASPGRIIELAAVADTAAEGGGEGVGRLGHVGGTDDWAVEVGERFADGDGDDDEGNEEEGVEDGVEEEGEDVVDHEDDG